MKFLSWFRRKHIHLETAVGPFAVHAIEPGKRYIILYDPTRIDSDAMDREFRDWPQITVIPCFFPHMSNPMGGGASSGMEQSA